MAELRGFLWLMGFLLVGEIVVPLFYLPFSASVTGLLLLTLFFILRGQLNTDIAAASQPLIGLLAMLIMPGVIGVFFVADEFAGQWLAVVGALTLGTLLSVASTLWLMRRLMPAPDPGEDPDTWQQTP
ncbi:MAG: CidA/LrgA family protein [Halomonas sp.]|uniref:CidA/LrgA family protein n=1 Tax=Halomonas sp. TaxID=1486246 RepID=UPI003F936F90